MVIYPMTYGDIRKVARFSYQPPAEKATNYLTPRGAGSDQTGGAVGSGIILNFTAHGRHTRGRCQAASGAFAAGRDVLRLLTKLCALTWPMGASFHPRSHAYSTIGGAIANNSSGVFSGKMQLHISSMSTNSERY